MKANCCIGLKEEAENILKEELKGGTTLNGCLTYYSHTKCYIIIHNDFNGTISNETKLIAVLKFGWKLLEVL